MDAGGGRCFHCAEPLPARGVRHAVIDGSERALCCAGCEAAAALIRDAGLLDYYRVRSEPARRADAAPADFSAWDGDAVRLAHVREDEGTSEITVLVEGIRCAACGWLIEHALAREPGLRSVQVNASTGRATLTWDASRARLSGLLASLARLGYIAHLPGAGGDAAATAQRRTALKRLIVAGLGMMQGMMFAEALYFGDGAMDIATRDFFRWVGLGVSTPVVFYAGWPFLRGAWIEWRQRHPGMDLLVATTIVIAWAASLVETVRGGPAVYFDSAVMFVFLLLATRHVEQAARRRANAAVEVLARAQPQQARRVDGDTVTEVPVHALRSGDRVRVRPGEAVPADGVLAGTGGAFDEALLSGESRPVPRSAGGEVLAGSVCLDAPVEIVVTRTGSATTLAQMVRLVERAQASRPRIALIADRIASRFVVALFAATGAIACIWYAIDPAMALPVALAVLAVGCPCALSLAVPAGLAATHSRLAREGALVLRPDALETLAAVDCVVLDKTGTLTTGQMQVSGVRLLRAGLPRERALAVSAALERESLHPLASAFRAHADDAVVATAVHASAGAGVSATIDGSPWRLGSAAFVGTDDDAGRGVWLADAQGVVARFEVHDELRAGAAMAVAALRERGVDVRILSGDAPEAVARIATTLGIERWQARQAPQDKLDAIRALQAEGRTVAMVGDGINDAAVLAGASVSIAMAEGAALAHAAADVVLATPRLQVLPVLLTAARDSQRIARQNLGWAAGYNSVGLVLAAFGLVPPWAAAIGMSVSSLVVTLNALRLAAPTRARVRHAEAAHGAPSQVPA